MRCDVTFIFSSDQRLESQLNIDPATENREKAQQWFAEKWEELECEPLRASGKVLVLDRILGVTDALGYPYLRGHREAMDTLATQCVAALGSSRIIVDLPGLTVDS